MSGREAQSGPESAKKHQNAKKKHQNAKAQALVDEIAARLKAEKNSSRTTVGSSAGLYTEINPAYEILTPKSATKPATETFVVVNGFHIPVEPAQSVASSKERSTSTAVHSSSGYVEPKEILQRLLRGTPTPGAARTEQQRTRQNKPSADPAPQ
jgi:hypothetical protein